MKIRHIATAAFILLMASFLNGQTPRQKTVMTRPSATTVNSNLEPLSFEFEVSLTSDGLVSILARRKSGMALFTPNMLNSFANYFYIDGPVRSTNSKNSQNPSFAIRPDKDSKMADTLAVINAVRVSSKTEVRIEVDGDLSIFVSTKPDPKGSPARPNPLFLLVKTDEKSNILLNNEQEGSFPNTSKLEQHLQQIFQERKNNGVWREGTNTTETTVLLRPNKNMAFANFVDLARAISRGGSDTVGLQVD